MEPNMRSEEKTRVTIAGLDIPFWDLVWFMVKLSLASIPAIFILYIFVMALGMIFGGILQLLPPMMIP